MAWGEGSPTGPRITGGECSLAGGYAVSGHKLSLGPCASEEVSNQGAPKVLEQHGRQGRGGSLEFKPRMPDVAFQGTTTSARTTCNLTPQTPGPLTRKCWSSGEAYERGGILGLIRSSKIFKAPQNRRKHSELGPGT